MINNKSKNLCFVDIAVNVIVVQSSSMLFLLPLVHYMSFPLATQIQLMLMPCSHLACDGRMEPVLFNLPLHIKILMLFTVHSFYCINV